MGKVCSKNELVYLAKKKKVSKMSKLKELDENQFFNSEKLKFKISLSNIKAKQLTQVTKKLFFIIE